MRHTLGLVWAQTQRLCTTVPGKALGIPLAAGAAVGADQLGANTRLQSMVEPSTDGLEYVCVSQLAAILPIVDADCGQDVDLQHTGISGEEPTCERGTGIWLLTCLPTRISMQWGHLGPAADRVHRGATE